MTFVPCGSGRKIQALLPGQGCESRGFPLWRGRKRRRSRLPSGKGCTRWASMAKQQSDRRDDGLRQYATLRGICSLRRTLRRGAATSGSHGLALGRAGGGGRRTCSARSSCGRAWKSRSGYLGHALLQLGRESDAVITYRRLSRRAGDPLERRRYLAKALAIEGKWDEAEKELRRLLAQAPDACGSSVPACGASVGTRYARRGRAASDPGDRNSPRRVPATSRGETHDGGRPPVNQTHARPGRARATWARGSRFTLVLARPSTILAITVRRCSNMKRQTGSGRRRSVDRAAMAARYDRIIAGFTVGALAAAQSFAGNPGRPGRWPVGVHCRHAPLRHDAGRTDSFRAPRRRRRRRTAILDGSAPRLGQFRNRRLDAEMLSNAAADYCGCFAGSGPRRCG